jgi:PKD repeat protein
MTQKLPRSIAACALAFAAFWLARAGAAPTVTFEVNPPNPVAGQAVVLRDTSTAGATSWLWDFGDGTSATTASPSHVWVGPGPYTVTLQEQDTTAQAMVQVSATTTLSLLASHPFEISIDAKDPNTDATSPAQAVAVGDRFGWFSFPGLTHDPGNVEVTVKVLEAPTFGHYWIFWSAMTSLQYTMTVRDVSTGQVQVYDKTDSAATGGWDTTSFPYDATTPTPSAPGLTPTAAGPTATSPPGQPTRTRTPTRTATPTGTPTPTPGPTGPTLLTLRALSWQWDWCPYQGLPCTAGVCPYEIGPGTHGKNEITLHMGCTYQLTLYNADPVGGDQIYPHEMNAHLDIGLPDTTIPIGTTMPPITLTIPTGDSYDISFSCKNNACANGGPPETTHELMTGVIHIVP